MRNSHTYSNIFVVFPWRTDYLKNAFFPYAINEWNKLELKICSSSSYNMFSKAFLRFIRLVERRINLEY